MEAHTCTLEVKGDWCLLFKPVTHVCACLSIREEILSQCNEASDAGCQEQWQHRGLLIRVRGIIIKPALERVLSILAIRQYKMCLIRQCNKLTLNSHIIWDVVGKKIVFNLLVVFVLNSAI